MTKEKPSEYKEEKSSQNQQKTIAEQEAAALAKLPKEAQEKLKIIKDILDKFQKKSLKNSTNT